MDDRLRGRDELADQRAVEAAITLEYAIRFSPRCSIRPSDGDLEGGDVADLRRLRHFVVAAEQSNFRRASLRSARRRIE